MNSQQAYEELDNDFVEYHGLSIYQFIGRLIYQIEIQENEIDQLENTIEKIRDEEKESERDCYAD